MFASMLCCRGMFWGDFVESGSCSDVLLKVKPSKTLSFSNTGVLAIYVCIRSLWGVWNVHFTMYLHGNCMFNKFEE